LNPVPPDLQAGVLTTRPTRHNTPHYFAIVLIHAIYYYELHLLV
jgi:hypothetical protein